MLYAQLPAVSTFHLDLCVWLEFECDGALRSLMEGRESNKLSKRSVSRI